MKNPKMKNKMRNPKGFSLIELIIVVVIIGVLSVVAYVGIEKARGKAMNDKMQDDLVVIANALEDYRRDHDMKYPVPEPSPETNQNILCYYADATYAHDCATAVFRQGMIDNNLLTKRYLRDVPTDPHTGSRYAYGVTNDGKFFQVAGIYKNDDGSYETRSIDNLAKGFELPSVIRAYDSPDFVIDRTAYLPYSPDHLILTGSLRNIVSTVSVNFVVASDGVIVKKDDEITTDDTGSADIYFSDGSITHIDPGTTVRLEKMEVAKNDKDGTFTSILMRLNVGKIWSKVVRLASNSSFDVKTTSAIAGVRGTEYGVEADSSGGLKEIVVLSGDVDVTNPENPSVTVETFTNIQPNSPKKADFTAGGTSSGQTSADPVQINSAYYKSIPLNSGMRPYIISAKYEENGTGTVFIRNVNYFADIVNSQLGLTGEHARRVQANYLAIYDMTSAGMDPVRKISIANADPAQPYTVQGTDIIGKNLVFRFENRSAEDEILQQSSGSIPPLNIKQGTDLTEDTLNPNLQQTAPADLNLTSTVPYIALKSGVSEPQTFTINAQFTDLQTAYDYILTTSGGDTANPVCVINSNTSGTGTKDDSVFSFMVEAKSTGMCALGVSVTMSNGRKILKDITIPVSSETAKLILDKPNPGQMIQDGQPIEFKWAAPGYPNGPFKLIITSPVQGQEAVIPGLSGNTSTYIPMPGVTGDYNWKVELLDANNSVIDTQSSNFKIIPHVDVDFDISQPVICPPETPMECSINITAPSQIPLTVTADTVVSPNTYEWALSGFSDPALMPVTQSFTGTINAFDLAAGNSMHSSVTLTIRDVDGNVLGTKTKGITVINGLPQFTEVVFEQTPLIAERGTSIQIPNLLIAEPAGLAEPTITMDKCSSLTVSSGGNINGSIYRAPTDTGITSDKITCTIPKGININGHIAASDMSATVNVMIGGCGNGTYNTGEMCDDGNTNDGDGCSASCQTESGWTCTGFPTGKSVCIQQLLAVCGDGKIDTSAVPPEQCDDNNQTPGDGCSSACQLESGYVCPIPGVLCQTILQKKCVDMPIPIGSTSVTNTNKHTYFTNKGTSDLADDECWALGTTTPLQNCTDVCSVVSLICVDGGWNDIGGSACSAITGGVYTPNAIDVFAPYLYTNYNKCYERKNTVVNTICSAPPISGKQRICKCQ